MQNEIIVKLAICLTYYHIGGLATTNIERLFKGSRMSVKASECFCPVCNKKISWFLQLPIISYLICRGKCSGCSSKIPVKSLILEISVFSVMTVISTISDFSPLGVLLSFVAYELIKIICITINGKRESNFAGEYIISVLLMIVFLIMTEFMALLLYSIKS